MLTPLEIIHHFYPTDNALRQLLLQHSRQVEERALDVCRRHPELRANEELVSRGAMLHDIAICRTDAPRIHCFGEAPYLLHGSLGAAMLRSLDPSLEAEARICERHTGTGLTNEVFRQRGIEPPAGIFTPETTEELIVSYADKFFSKSHPERTRTPEQTARSLEGFGAECAARFWAWHKMFG